MTTAVTLAPSEGESMLVAFARLEGKIDVVLSQHDARILAVETAKADHEERLRVMEATPPVPPAVLARLNVLETRSTVSVRDLLGGLVAAVAVMVGVSQLINAISGG